MQSRNLKFERKKWKHYVYKYKKKSVHSKNNKYLFSSDKQKEKFNFCLPPLHIVNPNIPNEY